MVISNTEFEGLLILEGLVYSDDRGTFFKNYDDDIKRTILPNPYESYLSKSQKNAIRGLHFQKGSHAQGKLVFCVNGSFIDLAADLRPESQTYGKVFSRELSAVKPVGVFVPPGFAHGIFSLEDSTYMLSMSSAPYAPDQEGGILWSSIGISFPGNVMVSEKDRNLQTLNDYLKKQD